MAGRAETPHRTDRQRPAVRAGQRVLLTLALALWSVSGVAAATTAVPAPSFEVPAWAFPAAPHDAKPAPAAATTASGELLSVPGSDRHFTAAQLRNLFDVPDWHPDGHPAMPEIVAKGRAPAVYACGFCHLPNGQGRVENAPVAGLPVNYIIAQVRALRSGERRSAWAGPWLPYDLMHEVAMAVSDEDLRVAATYFSSVPLTRRALVTEAERIPQMRIDGVMYVAVPHSAQEPLVERIVEIAEDQERHERRDAALSYRAFVPPGSIDAGRRLAEGDAGTGRMACRICHGEDLRGTRLAPPIAGRSPTYLLRQLIAFRTGARTGMNAAPMQPVAATLTLHDMIRLVAYAASLPP